MYVTESLRNYIITPFFYLYVLKRISINAFSLLILSIKHCITQKEKLKNEYLINKTSSQKYPSWCSTFLGGGIDLETIERLFFLNMYKYNWPWYIYTRCAML